MISTQHPRVLNPVGELEDLLAVEPGKTRGCRVQGEDRDGRYKNGVKLTLDNLRIPPSAYSRHTRYGILEFQPLLDSSSISSVGWTEIAVTEDRDGAKYLLAQIPASG